MDDARANPGYLHLIDLNGGKASWLHMCIRHAETGNYLMNMARLDDLVVDALLEEDTRSRVRSYDDGIMVLLKAMHVRSEEMAEPEDMVSMRIWIDSSRVITTREADVDPIVAIATQLSDGGGPSSPGEFIAALVNIHLDEVASFIEMLEDDVERIDGLVASRHTEVACPTMAETQTRISGFLRHLGPQKSVLETLSQSGHIILSERDRSRLDDGLNQLLRYLETLQNLRERVDILNDQISRIQDRRLNRSSYAFAVAATIFLPLGFITGLFGVNLLGIPMSQSPFGFSLLLVGCAALAVAMLFVFRWRRWL